MAGVKFTRESAARVAKATRAYEGSQQQSNPAARGNVAFAPWDTLLVGKTDAAHNKSASGTVSIWSGTTSGGLTDTTDNVTAYNRMGNIGSDKWVYVWTFPWGYEITAAEC